MATVHLDGSFGTPREAIDADFDYFGETIRVHPDASDLFTVELMTKAQSMDLGEIDFEDPRSWTREQARAMAEANEAALNAIKGQIHPDDWDRFLRTARVNRQRTLDLMNLSQTITEAMAGFPTGPSAGSSTTPAPTVRSSKPNSSGRGRSRGASVADQRKALKLLHGRPDLQMAVVRAAEAG